VFVNAPMWMLGIVSEFVATVGGNAYSFARRIAVVVGSPARLGFRALAPLHGDKSLGIGRVARRRRRRRLFRIGCGGRGGVAVGRWRIIRLPRGGCGGAIAIYVYGIGGRRSISIAICEAVCRGEAAGRSGRKSTVISSAASCRRVVIDRRPGAVPKW
jgi:hypothetical protein